MVFKCFKQPLEGLLKASKSGEWTLSQSDASAETHKSRGSVNPSCATAGSCLSGVRYQIFRAVPVNVLPNVMHTSELSGGGGGGGKGVTAISSISLILTDLMCAAFSFFFFY